MSALFLFLAAMPLQASPPEWEWNYLPAGLLYEPYIAAPRQSRTSTKLLLPFGGKDGHRRIEGSLGLNQSVARLGPIDEPWRGFEAGIEVGVFARFDSNEHWDQDAADWRWGFPLTYRDGEVAWKLHVYHVSSHLGDEFIRRTERKRLSYHLWEAAFGASWDLSNQSRIYGEVGAAIYTGSATESGRVQAGYEWRGPEGAAGFAPYAAVDLQARNEQRWNVGKTLAAGITYERVWRLGLEVYHGRDPQTQFLLDQVRTVAVTMAVEF